MQMIGVKEPLLEYSFPGESGSLGNPDGRITLARGEGPQVFNGLAETTNRITPVHEQEGGWPSREPEPACLGWDMAHSPIPQILPP